MDAIRTFIAVDVKVEQSLKSKWQELKGLLRKDKIKWVDDHSLHLTLFFLGDTPTDTVSSINERLEKELNSIPQFRVTVQGIGSFGHSSSPKVIWAGMAHSEQLLMLQKKISNVITSCDFEEDSREFSPHFTLGRVKQMYSANSLIAYIEKNKSIVFQDSLIESVVFYKSDLTPEGPIYTSIKTFKLLCP